MSGIICTTDRTSVHGFATCHLCILRSITWNQAAESKLVIWHKLLVLHVASSEKKSRINKYGIQMCDVNGRPFFLFYTFGESNNYNCNLTIAVNALSNKISAQSPMIYEYVERVYKYYWTNFPCLGSLRSRSQGKSWCTRDLMRETCVKGKGEEAGL